MIRIGYSTSGLINLDLSTTIRSIKATGYSDIELSFHKKQFNPFQVSYRDLISLKKELNNRCLNLPANIFSNQPGLTSLQ